jgi:hypothetical protein
MAVQPLFNICTFNMKGFNTGLGMLRELTLSHSIIAIQEHWLHTNMMSKLSCINDNFAFHGVSGMSERLATG